MLTRVMSIVWCGGGREYNTISNDFLFPFKGSTFLEMAMGSK